MVEAARSIGIRIAGRCSHAVLVAVAAVSIVAFLGRSTSAQTAAPPSRPSAAAESRDEAIALEPDKPVEFRFTGNGKQAYSFELSQGQYTSIRVDCPNLRAKLSVLDPADKGIDLIYGNPKFTSENVEVAAEKPGRYRLLIEAKPPSDSAGLCAIQLAAARSASENDLQLQMARIYVFDAVNLVKKNPDKASDLLQKAVATREKILGPLDQSLVRPLSLLGEIYLNKPDYPKSEAFYTRAVKVQDSIDPSGAPAFSPLNNLGELYAMTDRFDLAEQTYRRAISTGEKVFGAGHPMVINPMVNLATLFDQEGDYPKAQAMYEQALATQEKNKGPEYAGLAVIISNLAEVYSERGDYANAVRLGQRAIAIVDKPDHQDDERLGLALVATADAYRFQGELDKAEPLYERSLKVYEKALGPDDPLIADSLSDLAEIYSDHRDFAKAETFFHRALEIRQKKLGAENSSVGASLDKLASLYREQGDYARAEPLYRQAAAIREKELGPEHPELARTLTHLSELEMAKGNSAEAESLLSRAIEINEHNAAFNLLAGSERQKLAYLKLSSAQLDRAITLSSSVAPEQQAALNLAVTTVLQRKGRVLDVLAENLKNIRQHMDSDGVKLLNQFDGVTSHLAKLILVGPHDTPADEYKKRINALKEQREQLEAEISRRSAEFRAASEPVTLQRVQSSLPADSALIEFVNYQKLVPSGLKNKQTSGDSRYIAYVIRSSGPVQWKELGDAAALDREIDAYKRALRDPRRHDVKQRGRTLDEKILQPLRPLVGDAGRLLISPDGQLDLIPFEALSDPQGHYAIERYSITYLGTGRDLLRMQVSRASRTKPLVIADPAFDEPGTRLIAKANGTSARTGSVRRSVTTGKNLSDVYFAPLGGTEREARAIQNLFPNARVLTGAQASKNALEQVDAPLVLHIATHGFFLEDQAAKASNPQGENATRGVEAAGGMENPLVRSGLALAGANSTHGAAARGILTALEAANLNLWGTKLVTLSACDTGVGEVKDREGVYGLRRAFALAGAESLVMSLWPVSDDVTREMMTSYYSRLKQGLGRGEALRQTELAMLKRKGRQHPFYWASFIQSGEWANLAGKR